MRYLRWLLLLIPVAILAELLHWSEVLLFITSALAVVPLAGLLGIPSIGGPSLSVSAIGSFLAFLYVWLPYMILPIAAARMLPFKTRASRPRRVEKQSTPLTLVKMIQS